MPRALWWSYMPRALWWSYGGERFRMGEVPLYLIIKTSWSAQEASSQCPAERPTPTLQWLRAKEEGGQGERAEG